MNKSKEQIKTDRSMNQNKQISNKQISKEQIETDKSTNQNPNDYQKTTANKSQGKKGV